MIIDICCLKHLYIGCLTKSPTFRAGTSKEYGPHDRTNGLFITRSHSPTYTARTWSIESRDSTFTAQFLFFSLPDADQKRNHIGPVRHRVRQRSRIQSDTVSLFADFIIGLAFTGSYRVIASEPTPIHFETKKRLSVLERGLVVLSCEGTVTLSNPALTCNFCGHGSIFSPGSSVLCAVFGMVGGLGLPNSGDDRKLHYPLSHLALCSQAIY